MTGQTALTDALLFRTGRMTAKAGPVGITFMECHEAAVGIRTAADIGVTAGGTARSPGRLRLRRLVVADNTARRMVAGIAADTLRVDLMAELYGQVRRILHRKHELLLRVRRLDIHTFCLRRNLSDNSARNL